MNFHSSPKTEKKSCPAQKDLDFLSSSFIIQYNRPLRLENGAAWLSCFFASSFLEPRAYQSLTARDMGILKGQRIKPNCMSGVWAFLFLVFLCLVAFALASEESERESKPHAKQRNMTSPQLMPASEWASEFDLSQNRPLDEPSSSIRSVEKNYGRAFLLAGAVLAYHHARYWLIYSRFADDWQYGLNWEDQKKRFFSFEAWRLDSNCFKYNWTHAFAGAVYYNCARANNLSRLESFLFSLGESLYWEYIVEWRELISINDNIFTVLGGFACGEPWYQIGKYFNEREGLGNKLLGFLNPFQKITTGLDGKKDGTLPAKKETGWHEFRLSLGRRQIRADSSGTEGEYLTAGFHAEVISLPGYGREGQIRQSAKETISSVISLEVTGGNRGVEEIHLYSRSVFFGFFNQDIDPFQKGYGFYLGLGSAFSLYQKKAVAFYDSCKVKVWQEEDLCLEEARNFRDKYSIIHVVGPVLDFTVFSSKWKLRGLLEAYPDFALVNAFALNKYSETSDISGAKTTLLYYGYYYGLGATCSSAITLDIGQLRFSGMLRYHYWESIEGLDRFQTEIEDDFHLGDSRLIYLVGLGYKVRSTPLRFTASLEGITRKGEIRNTAHQERENRLFVGIDFAF